MSELLNIVKIDKSDIATAAQHIISEVQGGTLNPLDVKLKMKALEKVVEQVSQVIDKDVHAEAEKHGEKKFQYMGASVELAEVGTKYDYSMCNDPQYKAMEEELESLKARMKTRETFLKSITGSEVIADQDSGEMVTVYPPQKKSTSSVKITF